MLCSVDELYSHFNIVTIDQSVIAPARKLIENYAQNITSYLSTIIKLSKIDPQIYSHCMIIGVPENPPYVTSGVFCSCDENIVNTEPVAGGVNKDYILELQKCINSIHSQQDMYFSLSGQSSNCTYINPTESAHWCNIALTGENSLCGN